MPSNLFQHTHPPATQGLTLLAAVIHCSQGSQVKKPSQSGKVITAKQTSDKQLATATEPLPAKQQSVKQPIRTTKQPSPDNQPVGGTCTKQPSSDKQPAQLLNRLLPSDYQPHLL
ncbi:hypothetical protein ACROYT_G021765 [Oculina patagonica]